MYTLFVILIVIAALLMIGIVLIQEPQWLCSALLALM